MEALEEALEVAEPQAVEQPGIATGCPSATVAVVRSRRSRSTRGRSRTRPKAARLSRSVSSSPAPPA
jgi:hypothetical protein